MKRNKLLLVASGLLILSGLALGACKAKNDGKQNPPDKPGNDNPPVDTTPIYEKGDKKDVNGTGLMFFETVGFNTKDATVFEENNERYVIYAGQEEAKGEQVFAARKATLVDGAWKYGEKHIIFKGNTAENSWDQHIAQPSVVKGSFKYNSKDYSYLMAYQANEDGQNFNYSIGLAVSNDVLGTWERVGTEPLIRNPEIYEGSYGFGSPVLINANKSNKLLLAYSFGETLLSGERVKSLDASDLSNGGLEVGYTELPTAGLTGRDDGIITNAGFALGKDNTFYIANDGMTSSNAPGNASSFEVAKAGSNIISSVEAKWTSIKKVTGMSTVDETKEDSLGWDELCSATFVTDEFGFIDDTDGKAELVYTSFNEGVADANYTGQLCSYEVVLDA